MNIQEAAALTHLSKRTLHHYDEIGLLRPKRKGDNDYRDYTDEDLQRLQEILLYREMGFALADIGVLLNSESKDKNDMMQKHKAVLLAKKARINGILALIDKRMKGEKTMDFDAFDMKSIEEAKSEYAAEAKTRWGKTDAYKQSRQKTNRYTKEDWSKITAEANAIFEAFYILKDLKADDEKRLLLAEEWRQHISTYYYDCSYEILKGLGEMYVADERFTENIDKCGEGTAKAMADSIKVLCEQKLNNI